MSIPHADPPTPKPKKRVRRPASQSDVQSSGADYGIRKAEKHKKTKQYKGAVRKAYTSQPTQRRQQLLKAPKSPERTIVVREHTRRIKAKRQIQKSQAKRDVVTSADLRRANRYKEQEKKKLHKKGGGPAGLPLAAATTLNTSPAWMKRWGSVAGAVTPSKKASTVAGKVVENAARELVDIPAGIVPTVAHIVEPAVKHPTKPKAYVESAKRLAQAEASLPIALYKHPGQTLIHHPVSTALLVAPTGKLPIRSARAVQRRAGPIKKGPLKIIPKAPEARVAELPGTNLKVVRPPTTGYARTISRKISPRSKNVTAKDVETRVDEDIGLMEGLVRRHGAKEAKKIYKARKKELAPQLGKKPAKKQAAAEAVETAKGVEQKVRQGRTEKFIDEVGLTQKPHVTSRGQVTPGGTQARVYKSFGAAMDAAERAKTGNVEFNPIPHKSGYAVVPRAAMTGDRLHPGRFEEHTQPAAFSPTEAVVRMYSTQWRRNVLALHPTWYVGNALEAGVRAALTGTGPASFYRGTKIAGSEGVTFRGKTYRAKPGVLRTMDPAAADELGGRVYAGGHLAMQANIPKEYSMTVKGHGKAASALRKAQESRQKSPPVKAVVDAWEGFSDFTMGTLSGRVEGFFQKGMMGKALSKDPLMNDHMIKTSRAAIEDAAKGLRSTHNQVEMGRVVDEMYGKYGKWSPAMRRWIANYTPFVSWTMNALHFLYRTMPRDHPVLTATAASVQPYVDEWLKDKGLRKFVPGAVPGFLQGAVPTDKGWARYPTRYTPFAVAAQFPEDIGDLILPQWSSAIDMAKHGINWKGQQVKDPDSNKPLDPYQRLIAGMLTLYEGVVPASQQISGPSEKYEKGERNPLKLAKPRPVGDILPRFDPFRKVSNKSLTKKKKKSKATSMFDISTEAPKSMFP